MYTKYILYLLLSFLLNIKNSKCNGMLWIRQGFKVFENSGRKKDGSGSEETCPLKVGFNSRLFYINHLNMSCSYTKPFWEKQWNYLGGKRKNIIWVVDEWRNDCWILFVSMERQVVGMGGRYLLCFLTGGCMWGNKKQRSGRGCICKTSWNFGAMCCSRNLGEEIAGGAGFPTVSHGALRDWEFASFWQNGDSQMLVISQGNFQNVLRMVENEHSGLIVRQQTDPLPGTISRSWGGHTYYSKQLESHRKGTFISISCWW